MLVPLALVMALALLGACGGGAAEPSQPAADTATQAPAGSSSAEPVTISWWTIQTDEASKAMFAELIAEYTAAHPNVTIENTVLENEAFKSKISTAMQSGEPPDVFQTWGGGVMQEYADAGLIQDLTPALQQDGWGDSFQPGPLSLFGYGDKFYGVPWRIGMVGFFYNKDLFEQAGITTPPATWAEFLDAVDKLKAAGITPLGVGGKDKWDGAFFWEYLAMRLGGKDAFINAYNRTGSFSDQPFVDAGARLKELVDRQPFQDGFLGSGVDESMSLFAQRKVAMALMGQWLPSVAGPLAADPQAFAENLGWFPFPSVEGATGDPGDALGGGDGFAVGKNASAEAIDFVRFLTSQANQTKMAAAGIAVPPVVKGAEEALTDPIIKRLWQGTADANYFQLYYDQYMPPAVGLTVNDAVQALFAGSATPETVAQQIETVAATELSGD
jgi:raffinose/stachyose/melibiose transport system substrate-binding protein